jgi:hypothetical protein
MIVAETFALRGQMRRRSLFLTTLAGVGNACAVDGGADQPVKFTRFDALAVT